MNASAAAMWVIVIGAMAFGLFQSKEAVQAREDELARLNREILASQETVHVLRAEWSYLNRPERLARLAGRHLALGPMTAAQIRPLATLPFRAAADGGGAKDSAVLAATRRAP